MAQTISVRGRPISCLGRHLCRLTITRRLLILILVAVIASMAAFAVQLLTLRSSVVRQDSDNSPPRPL